MISRRIKFILAILSVLMIVLIVQANEKIAVYLPIALHWGGNPTTMGHTPTATSNSPANSPTPTQTLKPTASQTNTPTQTPTPTPTFTPTRTSTPTITGGPYPSSQVNSLFEIEFTGPASIGMGTPNPFLIDMEITFSGSGGEYTVPGFYDGDGQGGMDGAVWKARFTPDQTGLWLYETSSPESMLDGIVGAFHVVDNVSCSSYSPGELPDFRCQGRLEYAGKHYLKFADGPYWLKGGINDPEDFLLPGQTMDFPSKQSAVDFLATKGINSMYMLFNNMGGDGSNVYPWVGHEPVTARVNHERYDVAKLGEWKEIFDYIQGKGMVLHLVFEDDSGWTGFNRQLYYRELIARFGHYNGLIWNIVEEFNENDHYSPEEVKTFAGMIKDLDAYDHPLTVHHLGLLSSWDPFLGDSRFDLTSFQRELVPLYTHTEDAEEWYYKVITSGRTIPVSFDEIRYFTGLTTADSRQVVWAYYLGGGNYELHLQPAIEYSPFGEHMEDMHTARTFMEELPYWQMSPSNQLLLSGNGYVSSKPGDVYCVYLPDGGGFELDLRGTSATFDAWWFNPRTGDYQAFSGSIAGGSIRTFNPPSSEDWVLLLD